MVSIAWGAKLTDTFLSRVQWIVDDLDIGENTADGMSKLTSCMAWESGRTFSAGITNKAGSGATGLIQFMPSTAASLGTTTAKLAAMTAEDQLNYVWKYFAPYKGKLKTLGDLYMAILWPAGVGKPVTYVLWDKGLSPTTFRQNAGIDINKDGSITKAEAIAKVNGMLVEGLQPGNARDFNVSNVERTITSVLDTATHAVAIAEEVVPVVAPQLSPVVDSAKTVTETATAITTTIVEPNTTATAVKQALSGWQGNLAGAVSIVLALMLDPSFTSLLGRFTTALATGNGRWGAFVALAGAAVIAYRHKPPAA